MLMTNWLQSLVRSPRDRRRGRSWHAGSATQRRRRKRSDLLRWAVQALEDRLMLTVQTFSISGGASVMEVPTNGANQVKYTVGFNGALTAGESASVTVNQALGS